MLWSHLAPASGDGDPPSTVGSVPGTERQPRTNLFLSAQLILPGEKPQSVRVRNLSASGARVDMPQPLPSGTMLLLRRGAAEVAAEVMWSANGSCGLRFTGTIDVARWMSDRPGAAAATAAAAAVREPTLAEDIALARRLVERLEDALASEPAVVAALGTELQALDLLSQLLGTSEKRAAGSTAPSIRSLWQAAATFLRQPPFGGGRP